ncbi:hypothetical protein Tco_0299515 [Tanacetum coccineum]
MKIHHLSPSERTSYEEIKMNKFSIEDPLSLRQGLTAPVLLNTRLEGTDKLPVIISKELKDEEKAALLKVLKSHKRAIAWKISDIKGIDPSFCTHKILMEDDFKPAVQHQRRVNSKIHEVIKKEVIKLLDARLIYPISDSPWVSLVHCVPKKGGMTVVKNEDNELIPTRHVPKTKISKSGIEVDRAKVDVIAKLPHPTSVKGENHASWSDKLDMHYGLPVPLFPITHRMALIIKLRVRKGLASSYRSLKNHNAYWALKNYNFDLKTAGDHRKVQMNELNELQDHAYENSLIYKEKMKKIHDSKI